MDSVAFREFTVELPSLAEADSPTGFTADATGACLRHLPPLPGLLSCLRNRLKAFDLLADYDARSHLYPQLDNPGTLFLSVRCLPANPAKVAYVLALADCLSAGAAGGRRPAPRDLMSAHSLVCKVLGSCYGTPPAPSEHPIDPVEVLADLVVATHPEIFGPASEVVRPLRKDLVEALRKWQTPAYARESKHARRWALAVPSERALAINPHFTSK